MKSCWICKKEVPVDASKNDICDTCNQVYTMILTIQRLSKWRLEQKVEKLEKSLAIHKLVLSNKGGKPPNEIAREYLEAR